MKNNKVCQLRGNYKIIKATNQVLTSIYCELKEIRDEKEAAIILSKIEKKEKTIIMFLTKELQNYEGNYKKFLKIQEEHNIIPLVFRNDLAEKIAGGSTLTTFEANYIALGTDSTAETENDTQLGLEDQRALFTNRTFMNNIAFLDKFYSSIEVGGLALKEIGLFVDGTATPNSGILLSRVTVNETMSPNETLTVNASITVNSAT